MTLEELARLCEQATPGPRVVRSDECGHLIAMGEAIGNRHSYGSHHLISYDHGCRPGTEEQIGPGGVRQWDEADANANLIAALSPERVAAMVEYIAADIDYDAQVKLGRPGVDLARVRVRYEAAGDRLREVFDLDGGVSR